MSPASESKASPNIQDVFLNYVRREKLTVTIRMIIEQNGSDRMLFKHAIAAIKTPKSVANYFSHS